MPDAGKCQHLTYVYCFTVLLVKHRAYTRHWFLPAGQRPAPFPEYTGTYWETLKYELTAAVISGKFETRDRGQTPEGGWALQPMVLRSTAPPALRNPTAARSAARCANCPEFKKTLVCFRPGLRSGCCIASLYKKWMDWIHAGCKGGC